MVCCHSIFRLFAKGKTLVYMSPCLQKFDNSSTSSSYFSDIDKNYVMSGRKWMVRGNCVSTSNSEKGMSKTCVFVDAQFALSHLLFPFHLPCAHRKPDLPTCTNRVDHNRPKKVRDFQKWCTLLYESRYIFVWPTPPHPTIQSSVFSLTYDLILVSGT